jgi:hypothetical protein
MVLESQLAIRLLDLAVCRGAFHSQHLRRSHVVRWSAVSDVATAWQRSG